VLGHVQDLTAVFAEFARVLRPGGAAVIYQMTAADWLTPAEAAPGCGRQSAPMPPASTRGGSRPRSRRAG
jgi:ubiquinone/menaquinone biosynthesis C-methylase UbiE